MELPPNDLDARALWRSGYDAAASAGAEPVAGGIANHSANHPASLGR